MHNFNSVKFVDSLAEVTSHSDKEVIERSLLQTLIDLTPTSEYRIYRVLPNTNEKIVLALMAYAKNNIIDTLGNEIKTKDFQEEFLSAINTALGSHSLQIVNKSENNDQIHIIYPAIDKNNDSFAVLIQSCDDIDFEHHNLVHGLLKVYANYLTLIEKSRRDKLTQLLNRETLESEITRILIRNNSPENNILQIPEDMSENSKRIAKNSTYWLGLLDIDFFKNINDTYGHLYGDEILILVARLLSENIRDHDFAYRFGGEEFVIILLSADFQSAKEAYERIRIKINKHAYANVEGLSVSIGISQINNQSGPTEVLEEADKALYYAKDNGRNQSHFYDLLIESNLIENSESKTEYTDTDFF